jgi:aminoglycoside 2'-N-acetyltransferase I
MGPSEMTPTIEILNGNEGWPLAEALDAQCYPPEVMATIVWRDVTWAHADKRIFVRLDGEPVCHAGLYLRAAKDGERDVRVCGIGGVMTLERARKQGCASAAMKTAAKIVKEDDCDFGLLFCEPHNVAFYESLGWRIFTGDVYCEQPEGRIKFDMMHAMLLPVRAAPQSQMIDLCGLPW